MSESEVNNVFIELMLFLRLVFTQAYTYLFIWLYINFDEKGESVGGNMRISSKKLGYFYVVS